MLLVMQMLVGMLVRVMVRMRVLLTVPDALPVYSSSSSLSTKPSTI